MPCYRLRAAGKANADGVKKSRPRDRGRGIPVPEANAELQANIDVCLTKKPPLSLLIKMSYLQVVWSLL